MHRPAVLAVLLLVTPFSFAADQQLGPVVNPGSPSKVAPSARLLDGAPADLAITLAASETYSLAPSVQHVSGTYYALSTLGVPTSHAFDTYSESGGGNYFGSANGSITVIESATNLGGGVTRYLVQVSALDEGFFLEPWVDASWAGAGLIKWRLDVGSTFGGSNPIEFASPIIVMDSGVTVYDTNGFVLGTLDLFSDTSTSTSLSGVAIVDNGGFEIAGVDVAAIRIWWHVRQPDPADVALEIVDAKNGVYLPGETLKARVRSWNVGGTTSTSGTLALYASSDTNITAGDWSLGSFLLPSLVPDSGIDDPDVSLNLPGNIPDGAYYIGGIISLADANAANNVNYDSAPITVSSNPDIRIRPLSLDFVEEPQALTISSSQSGNTITAHEMTLSVLPALAAKARSEGNVRVIVGLNASFTPEGHLGASHKQAQRQQIRGVADQVLAELMGFNVQENRQFRFIPYIALTVDAHALQQLANSPLVATIEEDSFHSYTLSSSGAVIGSPLAWAEGADGSGQVIAVLDSGVDSSHPWFTVGGNKIVSEACYSASGGGLVSVCPGGVASSTAPGSGTNCPITIQGCDHGTHVAGIVAGNDGIGPNYGVARGADLIAIQVTSTDGITPIPLKSNYIMGLERVYELRNDFDIAAVNLSLGGGRYFDQATCNAANPSTKAAIDNLRSVGIATVIAAGNKSYTDSISAPGCISSAISVGNSKDNDEISPSSNIYPQIHLVAPGTDITSSVPIFGTDTKEGTSMAAPQVAGAWAVLKQLDPAASVATILNRLQNSATLIDDTRPGGIETDLPRINVDLAIGEPRTTFGIFNDGLAALSITSIQPATPAPWINWSPNAPFNVQPGQLQVVSVDVDFASAPVGASQTRLLINSNDPDESPFAGGVYVNVTALERPEPEFDSTPAPLGTLAFGDRVEQVESSALQVQVHNLGDADLTLACAITGANQSSFILKVCPSVISSAKSANISVSCQPNSTGNKIATLEVSTNDADESNLTYGLTCTGVAAPAPEFSSTPAAGATLAFGDQVVDTESGALAVQVNNLGNANLTLGCSIIGPNVSTFILKGCPTPIVGAASANVSVACLPGSLGAKSATLRLTTNDADETLASYDLTCTGVEPPPPDTLFSDGFED